MSFSTNCLLVLTASSILALPARVCAHDLPGSTDFNLVLPEDQFTGQIMFITYIGPPSGQYLWHLTAGFTWVSNGGTPASNVLVSIEIPINGMMQHWTVTGADLGWGSGPGTYTGSITTDLLNGLITPNGPFGGTIINVDIGTTTGDGLSGGHFDNSSFTLELNPIPAPGPLALFCLGLAFRSKRRNRKFLSRQHSLRTHELACSLD